MERKDQIGAKRGDARDRVAPASPAGQEVAIPSGRVVFLPAPGKIYSREELVAIFARFHPGDEIIVALQQILQKRQADAAIAAADPSSDRHASGRLWEVHTLREELSGYFTTRGAS